jgi:hypothetical protein
MLRKPHILNITAVKAGKISRKLRQRKTHLLRLPLMVIPKWFETCQLTNKSHRSNLCKRTAFFWVIMRHVVVM